MATNPYMAGANIPSGGVSTGGGVAAYWPDGKYSGTGMSNVNIPSGGVNTIGSMKNYGNPSFDPNAPQAVQTTGGYAPAGSVGQVAPGSMGSTNAMATQSYGGPAQNLGMGQMRTDWNSYFDGAKPGSSTAWGGGTLTMGDNGEAKYAAQGALNGGTTINRNSIDNPNSLQSLMAQAPGIAQQWKQQYGVDAGLNANDQNYWSNALSQQGRTQTAQPAPQPAPQGQPQAQNPYMAPQGGNLGMTPQALPMQGQPSQGGTPAFDSGRTNPWIAAQGQALTAQSNQNLRQNILPGIGQGAQAAGMYGSSRQGIAEGQAMGNAQTGLNSALAGLYSNAYGQDQQYDLGLRSNDLGFANLDANINNSNFSNQMQGANFGLSVYDRMNGYGLQDITNATNMQNTPINYFNQFNQNANNIAGQGGTSTSSQNNPGNPYIGALGGLQLGSQLFGGKP